jgi:hypothetical protein
MAQPRLTKGSRNTVLMHCEKIKSQLRVPYERLEDFIKKFKLDR